MEERRQQAGTENQWCEECKTKEYKYKCPGCSRRTCSLPCVNSHKQRSGCSGKRDSTHFLSLSQFDDATLLSDYNLLEDVKRVAESAQRMRVKICGYPQFRLPFHLKALRGAAGRKGTKLLFLPAGMSKREKNRTRYNQRKKSISWTIEWRFHSTDVVLLEHGVHESATLCSVVEKHLQPSPWKNKLRRFCEEDLDNLKFFIRKYHKGSKAPYRELDLNTPLSQLFAGLVILEYPVIHVFLPSDNCDFEVVKDLRPPPIQSKVPKRDNTPSPVGVVFKEEEIIEEEGAPEPQIIDLLKYSEDARKTTSHTAQINDNCSNDSSNPSTSGKEVEMLDAKIDDFDFDQDLIDAYSFLMNESNPDDFLDYKFEDVVGDHGHNTNVCFPDVEELEEGEIPNSD